MGVPKINTKILLGLVTFLLLIASLAAAQVEVSDTAGLTIKVDYNKLQDKDDQFEFSQSLSLINKGTAAENVSITFSGVQADYEFKTSENNFELAAGATKSVTLSGKTPVKMDEGNASNVATLTVNGQANAINLDVAPMLELDKIYFYIDESEVDTISTDGDKTSDFLPGDKVEMRFILENLFNDNYDEGTIDGDITINLDDSDFGDDELDEEVSFSLDAGDKFSQDEAPAIEFIIPSEADEGSYNLDITVTGKDDNKAEYEIQWSIELKVERKNDDIRVQDLTVAPAEVSCSRKITVSAKASNLGSDDQKYAAMIFTSPELGLYQKYDFTLNEGGSKDSFVLKEYSMDIPAKLKAGTYTIVARTYYDYNTLSDALDVDVVVKDCSTATSPAAGTGVKNTTGTGAITGAATAGTPNAAAGTQNTAAASQNINAENTVTPAPTPISSSIVAESIEPESSSSASTDDYIVAAMIVGIVLVFVMIILLMLVLLK